MATMPNIGWPWRATHCELRSPMVRSIEVLLAGERSLRGHEFWYRRKGTRWQPHLVPLNACC